MRLSCSREELDAIAGVGERRGDLRADHVAVDDRIVEQVVDRELADHAGPASASSSTCVERDRFLGAERLHGVEHVLAVVGMEVVEDRSATDQFGVVAEQPGHGAVDGADQTARRRPVRPCRACWPSPRAAPGVALVEVEPVALGDVAGDDDDESGFAGRRSVGTGPEAANEVPVYRARDTRLGRSVALKVLGGSSEMALAARDRFKREARAVAALDHPNICALYDVGSAHHGGPSGPVLDYLVMEYLDGQTLQHRLEPRGPGRAAAPLPPDEALAFGLQVVDALAAAHDAGIVHRDLKPSNIMLVAPRPGRRAAAHAKLLDFGVAKHVAVSDPGGETKTAMNVTSPGTVLGTLGYLSPEQARGEDVDARSDLFAFGAVFFEMLTGRPAFTRPSGAETIAAVLYEQPPRPSSLNPAVPAACDAIVEKALEKRRELRYQSADEIQADIRRALREPSSRTALPSLGATLAQPVLSGGIRRWLAWGVASLAALLIVALAASWGATRAGWWNESPPPAAALAGGKGVIDLEDAHRVTDALGWEDEAALSPNGAMVAYVSNESGNPDVWIAYTETRGGSAVPITKDSAVEQRPGWYPDGSAIVFASNLGGTRSIWKAPAPLPGTPVTLVQDAWDPAISPGADQVAFVRNDSTGCPRVHVARLVAGAAGTLPAQRLVTTSDGPCREEVRPAWSPDGREICYVGDRALWVVSASGGTPRKVTRRYEYRQGTGVGDQRPDRLQLVSKRAVRIVAGAINRHVRASAGDPRGGPRAQPEACPRADSGWRSRTSRRTRTSTSGTSRPARRNRYGTTVSEIAPAFTASGAHLIFSANRPAASGGELWKVPLGEGKPSGAREALVTGEGSASGPRCSPDGKWVVCTSVFSTAIEHSGSCHSAAARQCR